jgi:hypothetical protein
MKKLNILLATAAFSATVHAQLFINEYLASNNSQSSVIDTSEFGKRDDWFEIYNAGNSPVDLAGYKVADAGNKFYTIPSGLAFTVIPAKGFVRIWADDTTTQANFTQIHVPFKLSSSGDKLVLKNSIGETLDSLSFGAQTSNVSEGRCPDGSATFQFFTTPTPAAANCAATDFERVFPHRLFIYPNPAKNEFFVNASEDILIKLVSVEGKLIATHHITEHQRIDVSSLARGLYFVEWRQDTAVQTMKLILE